MTAKKYPPENCCSVVRELAAKGAAQRSIARALGTSLDTFNRWREETPEIEDALQEGRSQEHDLLVGTLLEAAVSHKNVTAAIFLLKARHNYRENQELQQDKPQVTINFELPGACDQQSYEAHILQKSIEPGKGKKKAKDDD